MKSSGKITLESMNEASWYNRWLLGWFRKYLKGEILEVGCGIGNFTALLVDFGKVTAIDIEKSYLTQVQGKAVNADVGFGDIEGNKFFFNQKKFDCAVSLNVLEHIKDDKQALVNIRNLLKPKGYLILLLPSHPKLYGKIDVSIGHHRRYEKKELIKLINNHGFKVIKSRRLNFLGALGWWVSGKVFRNKEVSKNRIRLFNLLAPIFLFFEKEIEAPIGISVLVIAQKS